MGKSGVWGGVALALGVMGCGGSAPPANAPSPSAPAASPAPASGAPVTPVAAGAPAASATGRVPSSATEVEYDDPSERPDGEAMMPLFTKAKLPIFPKKSVNDRDCWESLRVTGEHQADYQTIVNACGAPAGLVEYAKPVAGRLHSKHDPRDVYRLQLLGGYCYRYFAVADSGIKDLDVLIEKPGGALVGDDKTTSPVAIIESDKAWCLDEDQTLDFHVKVDGDGTGGYAFGVWARPKKK